MGYRVWVEMYTNTLAPGHLNTILLRHRFELMPIHRDARQQRLAFFQGLEEAGFCRQVELAQIPSAVYYSFQVGIELMQCRPCHESHLRLLGILG